ncbi:hypothetical protein ACFGVR_11100 [Mucilaginibacter sp. AW1-3]
MADTEYKEPASWAGSIISGMVILLVIVTILLNDGCRDKIHRIYNFIPPQKAKITLTLQSGPGNFLPNQALVFDGKDSLTTDNEGEVIIDDLPMGKHRYTVMYGDSLHSYTLNLKKDSLITVTLRMQGNDIVNGEASGSHAGTVKQSAKGTVLMYGSQWFTVGKSVQFGAICVKLVKLDNATNSVYVDICHTVANFACQTGITGNEQLSRDNWIRFTDGGYDYRLVLNKIDNTPGDTKDLAAFVSLTQTVR